MESYTEGLLQDKLREVKVLATAFNSRLIAEELRLPDSESNNESFRKLKYRHATIIVNTARLAKADLKRQGRKLRMPREDFNSAVLADLVKSRDLLAQLKEVFEDLERLKAFAKRQEQIDKMIMSNLERLRMEPSSVRISSPVRRLFLCRQILAVLSAVLSVEVPAHRASRLGGQLGQGSGAGTGEAGT